MKTILEAVKFHAEHNPESPCLGDLKSALTYGEAYSHILSGAAFLREKGVKPGDIVVIKTRQTVEFIVGFYSVELLGAIVCPLEKTASIERAKSIIEELGAAFYIEEPRKGDTVIQFEGGVQTLNLKELFSHEERIEETYFENEVTDLDRIAEIIYTTGTTGKSKGILVSHRTDMSIAENVIDSVSMQPDERELITTPLSHSLAIRRVHAAMLNGSMAVLTDKFIFIKNFFQLLERYDITAITFVPAILNGILDASGDRISEYNDSLRYIQLGSSPLHESEKERLIALLPSVRLYNTYGATESGCTIILEFSKYRNKKNCIGRPTVNTEVFFVDSDMHEIDAVSEESAGRMAFRGGMNMSGYVNAPLLTAEVLIDGAVYTNDIGYRGEDSLIYILGRLGDVINMGGLKINPDEVEDAANKYPGIKECACVPMEDSLAGFVPKLFVVLNEGVSLDEKGLRAFIGKYLETYKVPREIEEIDKIPRTFSGKIIRRELIN